MRNFFSLFKVQFLSVLGINSAIHNKKKGKIRRFYGIILLPLIFAFAFLYVGSNYSKMYLEFLEPKSIITFIIGITIVINVTFSFYSAINNLYGYKDYDMLASMPIKTRQVVFSKLVFYYISDLILSLLILIGGYYGLISSGQTGDFLGAEFIIKIAIYLLVSPFYAITVSILLGTLIAYISTKFIRKGFIQTLLFILVIVFFCYISYSNGMDEQTGMPNTNKLIEYIYLLNPIMIKGMSDITYYILTVAIHIALFALISIFVISTYKKLNTVLLAKKKRKGFRLKEYKTSSQFGTLFKKELSRLFSCPIYCINTLIGMFISLFASLIFALVFQLFGLLSEELVNEGLKYFPVIIGFMFTICPTTAPSVSIEGQSFWVIRTSPVKMNKVFNNKIFVNMLFGVPIGIICSIIIATTLKMNFLTAILFALLVVSIVIFASCLGLFYNILFPLMKWDTPNKPVKQGMSVFMTTLTGMGFSALLGVGAYYLNIELNLLFLIMFLTTLILALVLYMIIMSKGEKILSKKLSE